MWNCPPQAEAGNEDRADGAGLEDGRVVHEGVDDLGAAPVAVSADFLAAPDPGAVQLVTTVRKRGRRIGLMRRSDEHSGPPDGRV